MICQLVDLSIVCFPLLIYDWRKFRARAPRLRLRLRESQRLNYPMVEVLFSESLVDPNLKI
jgi:hypothetical protein